MDFSNGLYIPVPVEPIPSNFSNDVQIPLPDQALPLDSFSNEPNLCAPWQTMLPTRP